ncbi:PAS domain-containing sensor histidine kinase [Brevibacillus choshinensis]|uniref:histidine kinase n=1 Tax=Brevibacillus choshinensis TaxID=54911 RepID=A0ABX7FU48_BRECH|nr:PAS domain-containing sensor histidine kinase [Brevibacillus choshinensis]QRG69769.1 PAS domain S-box protein [Brevibacillus choshinensis]
MNLIGYQDQSILTLFWTGWIPFVLAIIWWMCGKRLASLQKKRLTSELEETKALLESLLQQSSDAVTVTDTQGNVELINDAAVKLFGYSKDKVIGRFPPYISEEEYENFQHAFAQVLAGKSITGYETKRIHQDGSTIPVSVSWTPIRKRDGQVVRIIGCSRDMTERKQIEQELEASEANYRLITENMSDMIFVYKKNGPVVYASSSHTKLLGYPIHELQNMDLLEQAILVHPDDLELVTNLFSREWTDENETTVVYRLRHRDGHWVSVESRFKPIRDEAGCVDSIMIVSRDVSEIVETKELLRQSDKLSAVGQLAAGIAHEIRNPLTSLRGFVQLLQSSMADQRYCEIMLSELDRINFIVTELLVLAKPQRMRFQEKNPVQIIHNVLSLLESQANMNNVIFHVNMDSQLPMISCDENQLKQVFINICKNAIEAMPNGGEVFVEGRENHDSRIQISIRDTGCGIEPSRMPRLGEPFYTTKEYGTGLGLMVSYRILEDHGGSFSIESERDKGTTVHITLPVQ